MRRADIGKEGDAQKAERNLGTDTSERPTGERRVCPLYFAVPSTESRNRQICPRSQCGFDVDEAGRTWYTFSSTYSPPDCRKTPGGVMFFVGGV